MARLECAAALSTIPETSAALTEVCRAVKAKLSGPADLAFLFVSPQHAPAYDRLAAEVCANLGCERLLGTTSESIVGTAREVEHEPAISLWAARLPGTSLWPMHLTFERTPEGGTFVGWPDDFPETWPEGAALLVLGDPFSFPADYLLERLNEDQPGSTVLGGMASAASQPGENRLWLGREAHNAGAVAVLVAGPVRIRSVVSQGCRPIGKPFVVTKAERNVIFELGGLPALKQLEAIFRELPTREQALVQRSLHVGRVVSEYQEKFEQGDFLVRNVVGFDPDAGAIAIGDFVRTGQTVQFHVRDEGAADGDLRQLIAQARKSAAAPPAGALLFTCNGRGTNLFSGPNHDAGVIHELLGELPVAGMFAAGEIGPVGGTNFLHGFTASVALFEEKG